MFSGVLAAGGYLGLFLAARMSVAVFSEVAILIGLLLLVLSVNQAGAYAIPKAAGSALLGMTLAASLKWSWNQHACPANAVESSNADSLSRGESPARGCRVVNDTSLHMIFLIGGPPRVGKSIVAGAIC